MENITMEKAKEILLNEHINIQIIELPLIDCLDYVLGEDIVSPINIPPFDKSPLDGYAYRSEDTVKAKENSPVILEVIDDIHAGYVSKKEIKQGQAIRIMTGAKIPKGADVIIKYEDTEFTDAEVKIFTYLKPQTNIIKTAEDMKAGDLVLRKGMLISPPEIGILATLGKSHIKVFDKPRVAVLSTGDELVSIDDDIIDGKIRNSNSYTIAAQIKKQGGKPSILGAFNDNISEVKEALKSALRWADMIITTGGASVGDADIIKETFEEIGAKILFWKVQMKPGSPIIVAKYKDKFLFGLSGNPAASYITFERFVRPIILKHMGKKNLNFMLVDSILENSFHKKSKTSRYVRAYTYKRNGQYYTKLPDKHSSGVLSSLSGRNSLFLVPEGTGPYHIGDKIKVELINHMEEEH